MTGESSMKKWKKPSFKEMRYGFEITMYILNR
jgi:coenzyme PQQ precursor peptide PqqA